MASVTRSAQSTRRARRQAQLAADLLSATEELMADGTAFTELSVDRLAGAAGISRATFYIYFEDKSHLLRTLAEQVFDQLQADGRQWWDVAERRDVADVRRALDAILATYRRHRAVLSAVVEMAAYDRTVDDTYRASMDSVVAAAEPVVARAIGTGPAHEIAFSLAWMVERACQRTLGPDPSGGSEDTTAALAAALTEIVWRTLHLEPAGPAA